MSAADLGACSAAVPVPGGNWLECGYPAVSTWIYGCEHEHVVIKSTCAEHEPQPGIVGCRQCWDAGHDCEMAITGFLAAGSAP